MTLGWLVLKMIHNIVVFNICDISCTEPKVVFTEPKEPGVEITGRGDTNVNENDIQTTFP